MAKKTFFMLLLGIIFITAGLFIFPRQAEIVVAKSVNGEVRPYVEKLVYEVNKQLKGKLRGKYTFYVANFEKGKPFPEPGLNDGKTILWLGSTRNYIPDLKPFDIVLTSTPLLNSFLKNDGDEAFYFPLFTDELTIKPREGEFIALIGEPLFVEDVLKEDNVAYVKYRLDQEQLIVKDLDKFQAVFIEGSALNDASIDVHPIILALAAQKIPLATYWAWPEKEEPLNLFNDEINFYLDKTDAKRLVHAFLQRPLAEDILHRAQDARRLVKNRYSLASATETLISVLIEHKEKEIPIAKNSLNFDLPVAVGHTGSGDFWLAYDLSSFLHHKGWNTSQTYFNSLYKYKTAVNIVVRGFEADDDNMIGQTNIYYLAYPQLRDDVPQAVIEDKEGFYQETLEHLTKYDAVATASKSLAEALTERGVETHYIPQFTNSERFYPDYDKELTSEVLFVGINAPYRRAAKIALDHKLPITIYGPNWGDDAKGDYIDNRILRKYYSSAKIVLNDTRKEMLVHGIISNRNFDASACGTLVISDYMPEIEEVYGDSVPMWKTDKELIKLIKYYLDPAHEQERLDKANRAREITLHNFTAQMAADKFEKLIDEAKEKKSKKN